MATPLAILPFAVLLLGEQVRWRRWSALVAGFIGVLLVVQPGGDVNWYAVIAFASTFVFALRDVCTRLVPLRIPSILITTLSAAILTVATGAVAFYAGWRPVTGEHLAAIGVASVMVAVGMHLLVMATRIGEVSVIAGFRYSGLVWGVVLGYAIWGDLPGPVAWAGIGLIVGAGLYAAHRERVRRAEEGP
jgi:drug/metabolite transporter (DMT)-like permease